MNQTFSFQRFSLLVSKNWAENKKRYSLSILAYISLLSVWFMFVMLTDISNPLAKNLQEVTFFFSLFLVGPFFASQFFSDLGSKTKGTNYLMVPASALEKLLCGLLYSIILFFIIFTLAFYLVDVLVVLIANAFHPSYNGITTQDGIAFQAHVVNVFNMRDLPQNNNLSYYFLVVFLTLQSVALLGSIYFSKYSYIKTVISLTLIVIVTYLILFKLRENIMPMGNFSVTEYKIYENDQVKIVSLPVWAQRVIEYLCSYAFAFVFWVTTYFRLKEKEV